VSTVKSHVEGPVVFARITAPPMNLLGPALVHDLVSLIRSAEDDASVRVVVFASGDPDYFISHVDLTKVAEYRAEAAALTGEPSIASLFRYISTSRLVTIAQIEGRVRGAGSEFALACDMRFAARGRAIFGQFEPSFGQLPGGGAAEYLTRMMGRGRALEVMLSADDYDADLAERYGWVNRTMPADSLAEFVASLAHRIAGFPPAGPNAVKERVNAISLAPIEDFRHDSDSFGASAKKPETQQLVQLALKHGFQTREGELELGRLVGDLSSERKE